MTAQRYQVNAPSVVDEIIDGEVVILHLPSGRYYSSDQVGAVLWHWIATGQSVEAIMALARNTYTGQPEVIAETVHHFIQTLLEQELITPANEPSRPASSQVPNTDFIPSVPTPFTPPVLQSHRDMQDLLLLDPIHDVDTMGWPTPKKPASADDHASL